MIDLSDIEAIKKIDPQNTLGSTEMLPQQLDVAWKQVQELSLPADLGTVSNIVFCGMGASIYGALVTKALLGADFGYPVEIVSDYHLPVFVNSNTLVVLTSYSGTTEEVLSCGFEALQKGAKMLILTKGGELADFARKNNIPSYIFDGALNPAGVPRLGNGYTIVGLMGLLAKVGIIKLNNENLTGAIENLKGIFGDIKDQAKNDVQNFIGKIPVIFAAEHLAGNAQILRNQFNETSKTFSAYYLVPDLNHHLMEGLQFPNPTNLKFISFNSKNYSDKIKKRMMLTLEVVQKNNHDIYEFTANGDNIYQDFLQVLAYGSFLTLYLGLIYEQNPATNPWVDFFKDKLKVLA
ncbi:MAG: hypothetical protein COU26_03340 [Candidatus Levybacteria bacterium CG10_big_fil_rev_8_21_14_0_10_36_30]|nr:MAG: hypothetical protein COU26_03340 [Candidatus Levybacteria bacterium CG10_big_fil_rev_8_21_14_0_10_36_30]